MTITARDLRNKQFGTSLRGYDANAVRAFMEAVAQELEQLNRDKLQLQERLGAANEKLSTVKNRENQVQGLLDTAQKSARDRMAAVQAKGQAILAQASAEAEEVITRARRDSQTIQEDARRDSVSMVEEAREERQTLVEDARTQRDALVDDARKERQTLIEDVADLRAQRERFRAELKSSLRSHADLLMRTGGLSSEVPQMDDVSEILDSDASVDIALGGSEGKSRRLRGRRQVDRHPLPERHEERQAN